MNPCFVPRVEPCDMPVYLGTSMLMITGRQEQTSPYDVT